MNPEINVMEIDKSKFYLIGISYESCTQYEVIASVTKQVEEYLEANKVKACVIPLKLNAQNIVALDESISKDLLEIIQQYKDKKAERKE